MTRVQHMRRVTHVQHTKSDSRAAHKYRSCAVHEKYYTRAARCVSHVFQARATRQ